MAVYHFKVWCEKAVSGIRFPPDRGTVYRELMAHLEDHCDALVEQGLERETAEKLALEAMGDAMVIAPQLAAIHRPFWGFFLRVTRVVLVLVACAALIALFPFLRNHDYSRLDRSDIFGTVEQVSWQYEDAASAPYRTKIRLFHAEPNQTVRSDGYTLTLTQAAWWHSEFTDENGLPDEGDYFYFQIEVFNPLPWVDHPEFKNWIWAEDSLGNHYYGFYENGYSREPTVVGNDYHTGPLTYTLDMWLSNFCSQEAEWIDLHYDRSGRNIVFRIDLTGGGEA